MKNIIISFFAMVVLFCTCSVRDILKTLDVKKPTAHVERTQITGLSLQNLDLLFHIQIKNPNAIGIELGGFDYDFEIDGRSFISGKQDKELRIPANGKNIIQFPVSLKFADIFKTYQNLENQDSTDYKLSWTLYFDLPILGIMKLPVQKSGCMPVIKLPVLAVKHVQIKRFDLLGADVDLTLKIKNPNAFKIDINGYDFQFDVSGKTWLQTTKQEKIHIPFKGSSTLSVPISLNFLQVGQSVFQLLSGGSELNYK